MAQPLRLLRKFFSAFLSLVAMLVGFLKNLFSSDRRAPRRPSLKEDAELIRSLRSTALALDAHGVSRTTAHLPFPSPSGADQVVTTSGSVDEIQELEENSGEENRTNQSCSSLSPPPEVFFCSETTRRKKKKKGDRWWRCATVGAVKDRCNLWMAEADDNDLDVAVLKATSRNSSSMDAKSVERILEWAKASPYFSLPTIFSLVCYRVHRTRSHTVALKSLLLAHQLLLCLPPVDSHGLPFDHSRFHHQFVQTYLLLLSRTQTSSSHSTLRSFLANRVCHSLIYLSPTSL